MDLKKILETIENKNNYSVFHKRNSIIEKILQNSSMVIEQLYYKYKDIFDLKLNRNLGKVNLEFKNTTNETILIPEDFLKAGNYIEIKDNFEILLILMKNDIFNWDYFTFKITQLLTYSNNTPISIKVNTLEKIRFFMNFTNYFPNYVTETELPEETKSKIYKSFYARWGSNKTYYDIYNRYLAKKTQFFQKSVLINPIPNYPAWNLQILICNQKNVYDFPLYKEVPLYPIQVFENMDGSFNSSLFLMSKKIINEKPSTYVEFLVKKFSFINNFNVFPTYYGGKKSLKLELKPIFESFSEFIDKYNNSKDRTILENKTFEFSMDFRNKKNYDEFLSQTKKRETIKLLNTKYKELNTFDSHYSTIFENKPNPYRILFKNRYSFPDFNTFENFILIITKKKNVLFEKTKEFFKLWTYQTLVFELKNKIIIYGYLPAGFNYNSEISFIYEILDNLDTKYEFLVHNKNIKQSTLTLYILPASRQFEEGNSNWILDEHSIPLSINQKEDIIASQINEEFENRAKY